MGNKGNGTYRALEARLEAKRYMAETENKERESETEKERRRKEKRWGFEWKWGKEYWVF